MSSTYWGYHLMIDVHGANDNIKDKSLVTQFCDELVVAIDMEPIGRPWVEETAMHDPGKAGFTLVQIIQTSSIVAHFIDQSGDIYLDVFSCKQFDIKTVEDHVTKWFAPEKMRVNFITRQAG